MKRKTVLLLALSCVAACIAAAAPAAGVPVAPPLTAAVFEIVNDKNLIWVSMDGKTWKAQ